MKIKPVKTKKDYENALERIEKIFDSGPDTTEGDVLEILVTLVESYELKNLIFQPNLFWLKDIY